jgi:hypothetical protein
MRSRRDAMIRERTSDTMRERDDMNGSDGGHHDMWKKGLGVLAAVAFLATAYFMLRGEFETPSRPESRTAAPTRIPPPPAPERIRVPDERPVRPPAPSPAPTVTLPSLADSDPFLRNRLEPFALPPLWVSQDGLMQRFAVLVDSATRGEWPRRPLRFLEPADKFRVIEREGRLYADPRNTQRFDSDLDLLERIDPAAAAELLRTIDPLLEAALQNLGRPVNGRDVLLDAIDWVLSAPAPEGDPELVQPNVLYEYADPDLESLPVLEKQLLRLGSKNLKRLKTYLGRLRDELNRV